MIMDRGLYGEVMYVFTYVHMNVHVLCVPVCISVYVSMYGKRVYVHMVRI
jgi:hypothetical protein